MITNPEPLRSVTPHGKFFSRTARNSFSKRCVSMGSARPSTSTRRSDSRQRLDELKQVHTTGLILTEAQSKPILDLAARSVFIASSNWSRARRNDRSTADGSPSSRGSRTLSNISMDARRCSVSSSIAAISQDACVPAASERRGAAAQRHRRRSRSARREALVANSHRPETRALTMLEEDFIYGDIPGARAGRAARFRRRLAQPRRGAAGGDRIQRKLAGAGRGGRDGVWNWSGWRGCASRSCPGVSRFAGRAHDEASELMPFVTLNGTCPPALPKTPMVSVVICAYNAERTMRPCLESLRQARLPELRSRHRR